MTTLLQTPRDGDLHADLHADLAGALDGLAAAAEQARDDARTRAVLAVVVQRLEHATDTELGDPSRDPLVVLQRRFGRAHARLLALPAAAPAADVLHGLALAVEGHGPVAVPSPRRAVAGCPVAATC